MSRWVSTSPCGAVCRGVCSFLHRNGRAAGVSPNRGLSHVGRDRARGHLWGRPLPASLASLGVCGGELREVAEVEVVHGQVAQGNACTIHDVSRPGVDGTPPRRANLRHEAGLGGSQPRGDLWVLGEGSGPREQLGRSLGSFGCGHERSCGVHPPGGSSTRGSRSARTGCSVCCGSNSDQRVRPARACCRLGRNHRQAQRPRARR